MKITHELDLDVSRQGVQATVPISQNDAGVHQVVIRLRNGGVPIIPQEGDHACLYIPDGDIFDPVTVYAEQSAKPGRLVYDVTAAASAKEGRREAVLQIANGDGLTLYSPHFAFVVKTDLTSGSMVTSSPAYAAVIQAQAVAENALAETEEMHEDAKAALEEAETVRDEANTVVDTAKKCAEASEASAQSSQESAEAAAERAEAAEQSKQEAQSILDQSKKALAATSAELLQSAKDYTDAEVASLSLAKVVTTLPDVGLPNRIYLVPKDITSANDLFDEYMWVNKGTEEAPEWTWEWFAVMQVEVDVDLAEYVKKTDYAKAGVVGVCAPMIGGGISITPSNHAIPGQMYIPGCSEQHIRGKIAYSPITASNLEYGVTWYGDQYYAKKEVESKVANLEVAVEENLYYEVTYSGTAIKNSYIVTPSVVLPYMLLTKIGDISATIFSITPYTLPASVGGTEIPETFRTKYADLCVGGNYFDLLNQVVKQQEVNWSGYLSSATATYETASEGSGTGLTMIFPKLEGIDADQISDFSYTYSYDIPGTSGMEDGTLTNFVYHGNGVFTADAFTYGAEYTWEEKVDDDGNYVDVYTEVNVDSSVLDSLGGINISFVMNKGGGEDIAIEVDFDLYIDGATAGETIVTDPVTEIELITMCKKTIS